MTIVLARRLEFDGLDSTPDVGELVLMVSDSQMVHQVSGDNPDHLYLGVAQKIFPIGKVGLVSGSGSGDVIENFASYANALGEVKPAGFLPTLYAEVLPKISEFIKKDPLNLETFSQTELFFACPDPFNYNAGKKGKDQGEKKNPLRIYILSGQQLVSGDWTYVQPAFDTVVSGSGEPRVRKRAMLREISEEYAPRSQQESEKRIYLSGHRVTKILLDIFDDARAASTAFGVDRNLQFGVLARYNNSIDWHILLPPDILPDNLASGYDQARTSQEARLNLFAGPQGQSSGTAASLDDLINEERRINFVHHLLTTGLREVSLYGRQAEGQSHNFIALALNALLSGSTVLAGMASVHYSRRLRGLDTPSGEIITEEFLF